MPDRISKFKIFAMFVVGIIVGALSYRYYSVGNQRRISQVITKAAASLSNSRPNVLKNTPLVAQGVPTKHYTADACIVWCFDVRFSALYGEFVRIRGYKEVDRVNVAGGSKDILSDDGYIIGQIKKSCALHHTKEVILMLHLGCGAYDEREDAPFYLNELALIKSVVIELLQAAGYSPRVSLLLAKFDGLYEVN